MHISLYFPLLCFVIDELSPFGTFLALSLQLYLLCFVIDELSPIGLFSRSLCCVVYNSPIGNNPALTAMTHWTLSREYKTAAPPPTSLFFFLYCSSVWLIRL